MMSSPKIGDHWINDRLAQKETYWLLVTKVEMSPEIVGEVAQKLTGYLFTGSGKRFWQPEQWYDTEANLTKFGWVKL